MNHGRIPSLDGLRGIAILLVFAGHLALFGPASAAGPGPFREFVGHNVGTGVDLFFVLSGFLITGILLDMKGRAGFFRRFYLRRTLRIFPLYYATLIAVTLLKLAFPDVFAMRSVTWTAQAANFTYTTNFLIAAKGWGAEPAFLAHFWSLAIEEQFYLFWPVIVWSASFASLRRIAIAGVVSAWVIRVALLHAYGYEPAYVLLPARMDGLLMGALIALQVRSPGGARARSGIAGAAVVFLFALDLVAGELHLAGEISVLRLATHFSIASLMFALAVNNAVTPARPGVFTSVLEWRPLRFFGKYSYAIYVFHIAVIVYLPSVLPFKAGIAAFSLLAIVVTSAAAMLSWRLLEQPFLNLRARFEVAA